MVKSRRRRRRRGCRLAGKTRHSLTKRMLAMLIGGFDEITKRNPIKSPIILKINGTGSRSIIMNDVIDHIDVYVYVTMW